MGKVFAADSAEHRIFILSPAKSTGRRADVLLSPRAMFDLALRVRNENAPIGEVFSFLSGLYFRGKLLYANHFVRPYHKVPGVLVITPDRGIIPVETTISAKDLFSFSKVPIDTADLRYLEPLQNSAMNLFSKLPPTTEVILLGSIGTPKYVQPLLNIFDARLKFPLDFVGRGDMSRGGLMLRSVDSGVELEYVPLLGAIRHGKRPPKLEKLRRRYSLELLDRDKS